MNEWELMQFFEILECRYRPHIPPCSMHTWCHYIGPHVHIGWADLKNRTESQDLWHYEIVPRHRTLKKLPIANRLDSKLSASYKSMKKLIAPTNRRDFRIDFSGMQKPQWSFFRVHPVDKQKMVIISFCTFSLDMERPEDGYLKRRISQRSDRATSGVSRCLSRDVALDQILWLHHYWLSRECVYIYRYPPFVAAFQGVTLCWWTHGWSHLRCFAGLRWLTAFSSNPLCPHCVFNMSEWNFVVSEMSTRAERRKAFKSVERILRVDWIHRFEPFLNPLWQSPQTFHWPVELSDWGSAIRCQYLRVLTFKSQIPRVSSAVNVCNVGMSVSWIRILFWRTWYITVPTAEFVLHLSQPSIWFC
jgi:hypothetical protein